MLGALIRRARRLATSLALWLEGDRDAGTGPLGFCQLCGRARRDLDEDVLCASCARMNW